MFTITGIFQGRAVTVTHTGDTYTNNSFVSGILTGDQSVIEKAQYENNQDHGTLGVPEGVNKNYLFYELSSYDLLKRHVFESVISEENDWAPYDPEYS